MKLSITHAETDDAIARCFPVMCQLRPHLAESEFVSRIRRQQADGYRLALLESDSRVRAAAGYRLNENLAWGRFCYVDDLITDEPHRSHGFGRALLDWLIDRAREAGCAQFHLDSGVQRFAAHRLYSARRMSISSHHFSMPLADDPERGRAAEPRESGIEVFGTPPD